MQYLQQILTICLHNEHKHYKQLYNCNYILKPALEYDKKKKYIFLPEHSRTKATLVYIKEIFFLTNSKISLFDINKCNSLKIIIRNQQMEMDSYNFLNNVTRGN